jgi:IS5 family transposase
LYRKAKGKEAKLSFGAHLLMENRHGLCAEFSLHNPITESEPAMALRQLDEHTQLHQGVAPKTIGADKNYYQKSFVQGCRQRDILPHVACKDGIKVEGLDGRTTGQETYAVSQRIRKRVEEIIGWIKTVGGLRRSRYRGLERTQAWGYFVAGTYNLLRLAKLGAAA